MEYQRESISTTTFDRLLSHRLNAVPTFIKIDVEGFEYEVLMGAKTILAQEPKPIWMGKICRQHESIPGGLNKRFGHIFRLFWDHGYKSMAIGEQVTEVQERQDLGKSFRIQFSIHSDIRFLRSRFECESTGMSNGIKVEARPRIVSN